MENLTGRMESVKDVLLSHKIVSKFEIVAAIVDMAEQEAGKSKKKPTQIAEQGLRATGISMKRWEGILQNDLRLAVKSVRSEILGEADRELKDLYRSKVGKREESKFKYQVVLSEKQAAIVVEALDFYSRIFMGQIGSLRQALMESYHMRDHGVMTALKEAELQTCLDGIKEAVFPELLPGAYYAIASDDIGEQPKIAWDVLQVLRNKLAWSTRPEGGVQVYFDEPMRSSREALPEVKVRKENA